MTALLIFISSFALAFVYGLQSQHVNKGHYWAAFFNGYLINACNLVMLKNVPDAGLLEMTAFMFGSPPGIVLSMWAHRKYFKPKD